MEKGHRNQLKQLEAQIRWGKTPLTSCFFDGCIDKAHDMAEGTKYNFLSCGGIAFANAVDCLAAIREVVYQKREATLEDIAAACRDNFDGHERLRAKLLAAPKHGNDDPRVDDIIRLVEQLRDEPMKEICRDPRDGSQFGNSHVVRSGAVRGGLGTPATPDGRAAGTPLASSVAASVGCEQSGPTAVLNSVCKLDSANSWQCGYQVNIRFHAGMIASPVEREKLRAMLNVYFQQGGQELQINVVDSETLRAAQKNPEQYQDLVVRVAGFSEFFVRLTPELQQDIIARMEHR
jgi:formate C-acetyltransferase